MIVTTRNTLTCTSETRRSLGDRMAYLSTSTRVTRSTDCFFVFSRHLPPSVLKSKLICRQQLLNKLDLLEHSFFVLRFLSLFGCQCSHYTMDLINRPEDFRTYLELATCYMQGMLNKNLDVCYLGYAIYHQAYDCMLIPSGLNFKFSILPLEGGYSF